MKIAVNLFLTSPKSVTGAFVYIQNILPALFEADKKNTYYLLGERDTIKYFQSLYGESLNVRFQVFGIKRDLLINPVRAIKKILAKIKHDYRRQENLVAKEIKKIIQKEHIDLYFSPASTIFPRGLDQIKKITAIMDLQHEYFPKNFSPKYLEQRRETFKYATEHSACLIAISEYTKKTLLEIYNLDPEKIPVIYFAPQEIKLGPTNFIPPLDFVFYPAALWPHKNHRVLIQALGILKDRFPSLHAVCPGLAKDKSFQIDLEKMAEANNLGGRILFPGCLFDGDLYQLFTQAKALVFPSSFEGFGIPLVEAFQFGLPIVAADNTSIREIVADAGVLVKTGDAQALAKAIEKVLTNQNLRQELIQKGRERAQIFSWEKAAKETLEIFSRLIVDSKK